MRTKFTARRQQQLKKATVLASKQTVEDALRIAQTLGEYWRQENDNDPRLTKLKDVTDFLNSILNKNPQQMQADGVSSIEEYFDDAVKPDIARRVKGAVDMISSWRRESRPTQINPNIQKQQAPAQQVASKKKADGGAAFVTDRDEKGEAKTPEVEGVPRIAGKKKAAPVAPPAPAPAPAAAAPAATPETAPIPEEGTFDIKTLSSEALAKAIKALTSIKEFESDKSAQALIEAMANELKTRPIEQEEPKAAAPAAPAAAPTASVDKVAVTPPGISESLMHKLKKEYPGEPEKAYGTAWKIHNEKESSADKTAEDAAQAPVSLGGLNTAPPEQPEPGVTASEEKVAVSPPGWKGTIEHMKHHHEIDNPYALSYWMEEQGYEPHHKSSLEDLKVAQAAMYANLANRYAKAKSASGNAGAWFVDDGDSFEVKEDGGRTPEITEAHSKLEDKTSIDRPATTKPIALKDQAMPLKTAAEMSLSKAVKESERLGGELKRLYLGAKPITGVNDTRPVREAVEAIFRAADLFDEAIKILSKQQVQAEQEEEAAKVKAENKGKKSSLLGLSVAASE